MDVTTIQLSRQMKAALDERKLHPRETYEDIIGRLLEDVEELDAKTRTDVRRALKAAKEGRIKSHQQLGDEMGFR